MTEAEACKKRITTLLDELETPTKKLTVWETDFIASVGEQFAERGSLSERQMEILSKIHSERA